MTAAIEKEKVVYVLERKEDKLFIHSPREAHKSHSVCMDAVGLDTGSDNAVFACLEMDYGEREDKEATINTGKMRKVVAYYEMDFGMNTVIRKKELTVDPCPHAGTGTSGCRGARWTTGRARGLPDVPP